MDLGHPVRVILVSAVGAALLAAPSPTPNKPLPKSKVDLGAFTKELMALKVDDGQRQLAMWFPFEFFVDANLTDPEKSRTSVEKDLSFLAPYHVVIVQCGVDKDDGSTAYATLQEVRARAVLRTDDGEEVAPVEKAPSLVEATVDVMKKLMASEGDEGSANMHVLLFPVATKSGKTIVDTSKKEKLTLVLKADKRFKETGFVWRTPFDATTPSPPCPKCKEPVSAKWTYCPWCGASLDRK
jgi:hypothetical protein